MNELHKMIERCERRRRMALRRGLLAEADYASAESDGQMLRSRLYDAQGYAKGAGQARGLAWVYAAQAERYREMAEAHGA